MKLFYLNQSLRFESSKCSYVKYLFGELYRPSDHIRLEFVLVEIQYNFQIPDDLIYRKISPTN